MEEFSLTHAAPLRARCLPHWRTNMCKQVIYLRDMNDKNGNIIESVLHDLHSKLQIQCFAFIVNK